MLVSAGCNSAPPLTSTASSAETVGPGLTQTIEIAASDTPAALRNNIVIVSENLSGTSELAVIQNQLQSYSNDHDLSLQLIDSIHSIDFKNTTLVYLKQPGEDWINLAQQNPTVKFILESEQRFNLPENAYQILTPRDDLVFVAGYLSALISEDWRTAALVTDESISGDSISNLFSNGVRYLCGLCAPVFGPIVYFPAIATAPALADTAALTQAYGEIANVRPNVIFISPEFVSVDFVTALKQNGITVISQQTEDSGKNELLDIRIGYDLNPALNTLLSTNFESDTHVFKATFSVESRVQKLTVGKQDNLNLLLLNLQKGFVSSHTVTQ